MTGRSFPQDNGRRFFVIMKLYTIGAVFTTDLKSVLLIKKIKPKWQKGFYNLPGGSTEEGETHEDCVSREFREECNLDIPSHVWKYIGRIENECNYAVDFLTAIITKQEKDYTQSLTEEECQWFYVNNLPENCLSNLYWLIPFALNTWRQGNADALTFGKFEYRNL